MRWRLFMPLWMRVVVKEPRSFYQTVMFFVAVLAPPSSSVSVTSIVYTSPSVPVGLSSRYWCVSVTTRALAATFRVTGLEPSPQSRVRTNVSVMPGSVIVTDPPDAIARSRANATTTGFVHYHHTLAKGFAQWFSNGARNDVSGATRRKRYL